jgi:hypothetical protein
VRGQGGRGRGQRGKGGGGGKGGEMIQTLYAHMNKRKNLKIKKLKYLFGWFACLLIRL